MCLQGCAHVLSSNLEANHRHAKEKTVELIG
jgi:hypothetical protein